MRMRSKTWTALLIVFISGTVIGFFGGHAHMRWRVERMRRRGPVALQEFMLKRLERQLHSNAEQRPTIEEVLRKAAMEMDALRERHSAELWRSIRESLSQMEPALTAEQKQVLDGMSLEDLLPGPPPQSNRPIEVNAPPSAN